MHSVVISVNISFPFFSFCYFFCHSKIIGYTYINIQSIAHNFYLQTYAALRDHWAPTGMGYFILDGSENNVSELQVEEYPIYRRRSPAPSFQKWGGMRAWEYHTLNECLVQLVCLTLISFACLDPALWRDTTRYAYAYGFSTTPVAIKPANCKPCRLHGFSRWISRLLAGWLLHLYDLRLHQRIFLFFMARTNENLLHHLTGFMIVPNFMLPHLLHTGTHSQFNHHSTSC